MGKGYVRNASHDDIQSLVDDLRPADIAEIQAGSRLPPYEAIAHGLDYGVAEVACLPDGTPSAVYGVVPTGFNPDLGIVWMLATNRFCGLHRQFLRECKGHIQRIGQNYKAIYNYTDARNKVHHRWLKWAGFHIIKEHPKFGVEGRPFYEFVRLMER